MHIKLLAFDLDGTALVSHTTLSPKNREALIRAGEQGVFLVPATGRIFTFLPQEITTLPYVHYAITANGGGVYDLHTKANLHSALISPEKALEVQQILDEYQIFTEYYAAGIPYTKKQDIKEAKEIFRLPPSKYHFLTKGYRYIYSFSDFLHEGHSLEKINLPYLPPEIRSEIKDRLGNLSGLKLTSSIPDNLEINQADATKGKALAALCRHLNLSSEQCMSIGDNGNDTDMLAFAGVSVAMGNSSDEALAAAKFRTAFCEEDGLALAIQTHILR